MLTKASESWAMSGMADEQSCFYDRGKGGWYHKATEYRPRPGELTKCKRLIADLVALHGAPALAIHLPPTWQRQES